MKRRLIVFFCSAMIVSAVGMAEGESPVDFGNESDYVVEQPGTITFRHGIVIIGKVEKPQVMIFLPKERSFYREISFNRSFMSDMAEALPFNPIVE